MNRSRQVTEIRLLFGPRIIRRTVDSKDNEGRASTGLPMYTAHMCYLRLSKSEMDIVDKLREQAESNM